jgi:hypothetical protein
MAQYLKGDCVNNAYTELRISGLTSQPSPNELKLALRRLEGMANEYRKRNVCVGYNLEDAPDANSSAGIPAEYQESFELCLARRLISTFGKGAMNKVDPELLKRQSAAFSFLSSSTAPKRQTQPGSRMALGSGNTLRNFRNRRFYRPVPQVPLTCESKRMVVGETFDFVEHFDSFLIDSEVVSSYTIDADTGLTIVSDSLSTPDVLYRINAVGNNPESYDTFLQVLIIATTDTGRIESRTINFELTPETTIA